MTTTTRRNQLRLLWLLEGAGPEEKREEEKTVRERWFKIGSAKVVQHAGGACCSNRCCFADKGKLFSAVMSSDESLL